MDRRHTVSDAERKKLLAMERSYARLVSVQRSLEVLREEEERRRRALQQEFDARRAPLWEERAKCIRRVDHFWTHTLANHDVLSHCMVEEDVDLMNAISELQVVDTKADGYHGYKIVLHMKENEFISDKTLWKELRIKDESTDATEVKKNGGDEEDMEYTFRQSGIRWKKGKRFIKDSSSGKRGGEASGSGDKTTSSHGRKRQRSEETGSGSGMETAAEEEDEEEERSFFEMFERETDMDADICILIKHEVWPNPVRFYARDAEDEDDEDEDMEEDQ